MTLNIETLNRNAVFIAYDLLYSWDSWLLYFVFLIPHDAGRSQSSDPRPGHHPKHVSEMGTNDQKRK